jgi:S-adenosylmethionine:tRNA ribosyltransferase-isomerase
MLPPGNAIVASQLQKLMQADELNFDLPPELIAQVPTPDRAHSRLLHYSRSDRTMRHRQFADLPGLLRPGDVLVMNDARVIPARLDLLKPTGGHIEGLFLEERPGRWLVLLRDAGNVSAGTELAFETDPTVRLRVDSRGEEGQWLVEPLGLNEPSIVFLDRVGRMPLPPYIRRRRADDPHASLDRERYQTVYARAAGSVAAPTAGLHFTPSLLSALDAADIRRVFVTLHVGLGTFKPVTADRLEDHAMHAERYELSAEAAAALNQAKCEDRRIVAVGTTTARVLESHPYDDFSPSVGQTALFIHPPYAWRHVDALLTNLHLPRSTLIALVAAFVGLDNQRRIYETAIAERYRFFSYGDATFLE